MANDMLIKALFLLSIPLTWSTGDQTLCFKNSMLLETTGDAILTVFVDANYGEYCNISSSRGLQQISIALHVVRTLNKYDYVPGVKLGLRVLDTCHDSITVLRRALQIILEQNYAPEYKMGVLMPLRYSLTVNALHDHGSLSISTYGEQNFTIPTIDILARYLSTKYEVVDLAHTNVDFVLSRFLVAARNVGVCVKRYDRGVDDDGRANATEAVIVAIGGRNDIQRWLAESEESKGPERTWLLLPLDNSDIDDLVPLGSYVIKPEALGFDLGEFSNSDEFLKGSEDSANHSPYLLSIGKAVVELAEVFQDIRRRSDSADEYDDGDEKSCVIAQFRPQPQREIRDSDVYEALRIQTGLHFVRYAVAMKTQHELVDVALYRIEVPELRVLPARMTSGMPGLCLKDLVENCENCANFQEYESSDARIITEGKADVIKSVLQNSVYIPVILIATVCGTLACCVTAIFIVHRFTTEETLDGDPTLTIVLAVANAFTSLTALPFCITDDYFGAESLNAGKILLATLAFAFTFSIMLSRALFLALIADDICVPRINGYLQGVMVFFISGVQIAISVTYFLLRTIDSAVVARSPILISLLGYNIFLLIALFVTSCFIIKIQDNYHEGKHFFSTAVGLLLVWTIWLICFGLIPKNRDTIVSFGIIGTAYSIIFGVLAPKIYYTIVHSPGRKSLERRFEPVDLPTDSIVNTIVRQSNFSYDYIHPAQESQTLRMLSTRPNYYSSPNPIDRCKSPNHREMPIRYGNYRFQAEMMEADYVAPQMCVEDTEFFGNSKVAPSDVIYEQPRIYRSQRIILGEKGDGETTRIKDNSSSRLHDEMYSTRYSDPTNMARENRIDEEDEDEDENENEEAQKDQEDQESEGVSRVTRF